MRGQHARADFLLVNAKGKDLDKGLFGRRDVMEAFIGGRSVFKKKVVKFKNRSRDAGLVCNINVVNKNDIAENAHTHTNPGKPEIMVMFLVRALLDNCGSVEEAKEFIKEHDITPVPAGLAGVWDCHFMIADPDNTVVVEFTGEKGSEVKFVETDIMTNVQTDEQFIAETLSENPENDAGFI